MADKLGILAGGGVLPRMIVDACRETGREFFVIAFEGHAEPAVTANAPHAWIPLGAGGRIMEALRGQNVREVVMAGRIERPSLTGLRPDWRTLRFLMRIGRKGMGDDRMLRHVIEEFEAEGFRVVGVDSILHDVRPASGRLGRHAPDDSAQRDIERGVEVLRAISAVDVGQATVVQDGLVLGVEAIEGTDALLERCGALRRDGAGGVLVKIPKVGQEARIDLPTIGPETVRGAAAAGLRGIAVKAGGVIMLDQAELIRLSDESGLLMVAFYSE
jgi:DUF1009 family protein